MRRSAFTPDDEQLLTCYLAHAAAVDGCAATTIVQRRTALRSFLAWLRGEEGDLDAVGVHTTQRLLGLVRAGTTAGYRHLLDDRLCAAVGQVFGAGRVAICDQTSGEGARCAGKRS